MSGDNIFNDPLIVKYFSVTIVNETKHILYLNKKELPWGKWYYEPPALIKANTGAHFLSGIGNFTGVEGVVEYLIDNGSFTLSWSISSIGLDPTYKISETDPDKIYELTSVEVAIADIIIYVRKYESK